MLLTTTTDVGGILPTETGDLLIGPITELALPFNPALASTIRTLAHETRIPVVAEDLAANWLAEGAEITPDDPDLDEITIIPAKVAALTIISRELADDSSPAAAEIVGQSMARALVAKLNQAFVGNLSAPAPKGLAGLTGLTTIDTNGTITNLDVFAAAVAEAEAVGANVTGWVVSPDDALLLATAKTATGSNEALLADPRTVLGRPVTVSQHVTPGTLYGLDASRVVSVLREDVEITADRSAFFTSDRVAVRGIIRASWAFGPGAVVKLADVA